ncbi:MAG: toll/interleukin-1 receptor domain-containing protein [Blastocatellales bacterium]
MKDFFISYTSADGAWAEWIAWQLEDAGYSVIIQVWDFRPGSDFIAEMDRATREAQRTIAVLSQKYLRSRFTQAEWGAAFQKGNLLPVRIQDFDVEGLLSARVYIDLAGKDEATARYVLAAGVKSERVKPPTPPQFPGAAPVQRTITAPPRFPGLSQIRARLDKSLLQLILYVNTRSPDEEGILPEDVRNIRDWFWQRSAHGRWLIVEPAKLETRLDEASLVVTDWSSENSPEAEDICRRIRSRRPDLPILIVYSGQGRSPNRNAFIDTDPEGARGSLSIAIHADVLSELPLINEAMQSIDFQPKESKLILHPPENDDFVIEEMIGWIKDRQQLRLIIQKFFPRAEHAYLQSPGGEWVEARLCRVAIEGRIYLLKFFDQRTPYLTELDRHGQARQWLGAAAAALQPIPELADQGEAFPVFGPSRYPVCYDAGASHDQGRITLQDCYRSKSDKFVEDALDQVLVILATDQPYSYLPEQPWGDPNEIAFNRTRELRTSVLASLGDLSPYLPRMYAKRGLFQSAGEAPRAFIADLLRRGEGTALSEKVWGSAWKDYLERLHRLVYSPLPSWLTTHAPVAKGHIYGNPISRNCLVDGDKPRDLRLINCGGYHANGRLVSDLALIERDLKLVLMNTEAAAPGFLDLEIEQLSKWRREESLAISDGLNYTFHPTLTSPGSVCRAYKLIGKVRQRAKEVSGRDDKGIHYFAALLYWTLEILQHPKVRPTKKLLALHSAAEILRTLDN